MERIAESGGGGGVARFLRVCVGLRLSPNPTYKLLSEDFADCRFIIHPVFCEFLDLDVQKQKLTLNFDWSYLQQQEAFVIAPA